jgi:DNA repair exonuclease SbcCD nuclease subunit
VHLESDTFGNTDEGRAYRRRIRAAFSRVVDIAAHERADLFLIAGDLFDSNRISEEAVRFALREIARVPCPVILIPGNHDCYDQRSVYKKTDFRTAGPHVHLLAEEDGSLLDFPDLGVVVWGRPVIDHDRHFRPLAGIPPRLGDRWHLALAHGYFSDEGEGSHRSSPISPGEISGSGWDYIALGHIHIFDDLSRGGVAACYAGTPAPLHLGSEDDGTVALVTLDPRTGVRTTPLPVAVSPPAPAQDRATPPAELKGEGLPPTAGGT